MADAVDIKVGYSCNNDCFHCVIADKRRNLLTEKKPVDRSTEEIFHHINESKENGAKAIVLTGGEITIRRDCFDIVEHALSKNFENINMQTNGRMFYYKEFAERMASYPTINLIIALHSTNEEVHDKITGAKGSFKQTVQGIKNLKKAGIGNRVGIKFVLSKKNYKEAPDMVRLAKKLVAGSISITFPHAMGNALLNFDECVPRYSEIAPYITESTRLSSEINQHINFEAIPLCYLHGSEECASEFVMPEHTELRDLTHLDKNYSKTRKTTAKLKGPQCKECKYFLICEGPWDDYVHGYGFEDLVPVKGEYIKSLAELKSTN
ncbi:radical SAM protein [Bacteroidota bacterium]